MIGGWRFAVAVANCAKDENHKPVTQLLNVDQGNACGEDSFCIHETPRHTILSIADGVGSWRKRGFDPGAFARGLMVQVGRIDEEPKMASKQLIKKAFGNLIESYEKGEEEPYGASTICIAVLDITTGVLDLASLGDSQAIVIRDGKTIIRTERQQSHFNAPLQLTLKPTGEAKGNPRKAYHDSLQLRRNDLVILATDGLWDNLFLEQVEEACRRNWGGITEDGEWDEEQLALELVEAARVVSINETALTPFQAEAEIAGSTHQGGKTDDITVIVAAVL